MSSNPSFAYLDLADFELINDRPYVFSRNGIIGRNFYISGINNSGFTEQKYEEVFNKLVHAFNDLDDEGVEVQFTQIRETVSPNDIPEVSPIDAPPYLVERNTFLRNVLTRNNEVFSNTFVISVTSKPEHKDEGIIETIKRNIREFKSIIKDNNDRDFVNSKYEESGTLSRMRKLDRAASLIISAMESVGCNVKIPKTREANFWLLRKIMAKTQSKFEKEPRELDRKNVRKKILDGTNTLEMDKYFVHDEYFHRIYRLESVSPDLRVYAQKVQKTLNAPFEFIYTVSFKMVEYDKADSKIKKKITFAAIKEDSANSGKSITKNHGLANELQQAVSVGVRHAKERACEFCSYFVYQRHIDAVELELKANRVSIDEYCRDIDFELRQKVFSQIANSNWSPMMGPWELFSKVVPGMLNVDSFIIKSDLEFPYDICHILPIFDLKRPDLQLDGINHWFTESDGIVPYKYFDPELDSWCTIVTGDMGSGKSVFVNNLIASVRGYAIPSGKKPLIRTLDFGGVAGSFYKVFEEEEASTLNFASPKKPYINPFDVPEQYRLPNTPRTEELAEIVRKVNPNIELEESKNRVRYYFENILKFDVVPTKESKINFLAEACETHYTEVEKYVDLFTVDETNCYPSIDKMDIVQLVLEIMLSPAKDKVVYDYETSAIMDLVKVIYDNPNRTGFPKISDLIGVITAIDPANPLISRLKRFSVNGDFHMFDHDTDINLDNDYVLFDMFGLDKNHKLKEIYSILIMDVVVNDMYKKMDRARLFIVDEAAFALESPQIRKALTAFSRTSRKYKFGLCISTQKPTDFFDQSHSDGKILTDLATTHIYCGFSKRNVIKETIKLFSLPTYVEEEMVGLGIKMANRLSYKSFARFMIVQDTKAGKKISTMKSILSPTEFAYYNSTKEENAIIRFYKEVKKWKISDCVNYTVAKKHYNDNELLEYLRVNNHLEAYDKITKERSNS